MNEVIEARLMSLYDQLPSHRRQPYGRIINLFRAGNADLAKSYARSWFDECRTVSALQNAFMEFDRGVSGCLCNILGVFDPS